ncbi:MAG TPA: hypothetical protein ENI23_02065 [bacterium]|nr:hypothetical protein [bacterium]
MTKRIITKEEIEEIEIMFVHWSSNDKCKIIEDLCTSHKLLLTRIKELEESCNYLEVQVTYYAHELKEAKEK